MARWTSPKIGRGPAVWAAWSRWHFDDLRRRMADLPSAAPEPQHVEGLTDVEREFLCDLAADRISGSVVTAIVERFGPIDVDYRDVIDLAPMSNVTDLADRRRRPN